MSHEAPERKLNRNTNPNINKQTTQKAAPRTKKAPQRKKIAQAANDTTTKDKNRRLPSRRRSSTPPMASYAYTNQTKNAPASYLGVEE